MRRPSFAALWLSATRFESDGGGGFSSETAKELNASVSAVVQGAGTESDLVCHAKSPTSAAKLIAKSARENFNADNSQQQLNRDRIGDPRGADRHFY